MPTTPRLDPDVLLAYVRVQRLTDRMLDTAEDLRRARNDLESRLARAPAAPPDPKTEEAARGE